MKMLKFEFQPQEIKVSAEEILADLNYPAGSAGRPGGCKARARRPRLSH